MQYRTTKKIIIDEQKLTILIRLGCPDDRLLSIIKTGKFEKTGDKIIDETLECLIDKKEFKNWGGNHNPKGINGYNKKKNLCQVDQQVDRSRLGQVVDKDKDIDIDKDIIKKNIFKKPSLEEVISYCQERNNSVDPNKWFNYYTANGWKVGRNPMKDWKATIRTWERNEVKPQNKEPVFLVERGKFYIDDDEKYCKGYTDLAEKISLEDREKLWEWFMDKFEGKEVKLSTIRSVLIKKIGEQNV